MDEIIRITVFDRPQPNRICAKCAHPAKGVIHFVLPENMGNSLGNPQTLKPYCETHLALYLGKMTGECLRHSENVMGALGLPQPEQQNPDNVNLFED